MEFVYFLTFALSMILFEHYHKSVEVWVKTLVIYAVVVSEVKPTDFIIAQPRIFWTLNALFFDKFSLSEVYLWMNRGRSSLRSRCCRSQLMNISMESHVFCRWVFISLVYFSKNFYFWLSTFLFYHFWSNSILSHHRFGGKMENVPTD